MSFGIGMAGPQMGPGGVLNQFGDSDRRGAVYNPRVVARLTGYLLPYKGQMAIAFLAMVVASGLTLLIPWLLKQTIDVYIGGKDYAGLARITALTGLAYLTLYASSTTQNYLLSRVGQRILGDLRRQLFRHLQDLSLGYHDTHIVGVTVSRVINDVAVINELLSQGWVTFIADFFILTGIIVIMVSMSPLLALLTLAVLPIMVLATWLFAARAQNAFRATRSSIAGVIGSLAEGIAGMRVIQAFAREEVTQEKFGEVNRHNRDTNINAMTLSFIFLPTIEFLAMCATAIVLYSGGLQAIAGEVTVGVLVAFLSYVSRFFSPIQELSRLYTTMQAAMAGGEQVLNLLDTRPDVVDQPGAQDIPPIHGDIRFENVTFRYRPETPEVLHQVSLHIPAGQRAALVGPTGAGKSTIANLVARFYEVSEGVVTIDGIDLRTVTQRSLRRQVGIVPQDSFLFSGTIAENIAFGDPSATPEQIESAARLANAHDFISALPEGYQTVVLENAANLSVGQRQLICIARAILVEPRILILDEATANIDTVSESLIQQALERLLQGRTAVMIAHRLSTIRSADIIFVIDDGRIVEQGRHEELLAQGGVYRTLYDRQYGSSEA